MSEPASEPVRVFLVDDHAMVRAGVRAELGSQVDFVGEAADVPSAVEGIRATKPDVVLLDVHLPGGGGRAVLEALHGELPDTRWLALSVSDAAEDVIAVIRAGARGYVTKTISGPDLRAAVRRVADGDVVFSPRLAGFVLDAFAATSASSTASARAWSPMRLVRYANAYPRSGSAHASEPPIPPIPNPSESSANPRPQVISSSSSKSGPEACGRTASATVPGEMSRAPSSSPPASSAA